MEPTLVQVPLGAPQKLVRLLFWTPYYYLCILVDGCVFKPVRQTAADASNNVAASGGRANPFLDIPRTIAEAVRPADRIFELVRARGDGSLVPADAAFIGSEVVGGSDAEPDKMVFRMKLTFQDKSAAAGSAAPPSSPPSSKAKARGAAGAAVAGPRTVEVFVKLPTARAWNSGLKALNSAFAIHSREVAFYNTIWPALLREVSPPLSDAIVVPRNLYAHWSRTFDRVILVSEYIDTTDEYECIPDWRGATPSQINLMLDGIGHLHAATWNITRTPGAQAVIEANFTERRGADWLLPLMDLYAGSLSPANLWLWKALVKRLEREPVTLSHGDCRPGNMLFARKRAHVIFTDWEAIAITPYLWDVTYSMLCGLPPDVRRREERGIIARYLDRLRTVHKLRADQIPTLEQAMQTRQLIVLLVSHFGWLLTMFGGVGKAQGNSAKDSTAWEARIDGAVREVLADPTQLAAILGESTPEGVAHIRQYASEYSCINAVSS